MNSTEIKELIDEVKTAQGLTALQKADLLASYLQAYHLAKISEELTVIRIDIQAR